MGNASSKPEQLVFSADTPVRFSQSVIDSLQRNPETDSIREKNTELKIQSRVNEELTRIRDAQQAHLADLASALTTNPPSRDTTTAPHQPPRDPTSLAARLSSSFYQDYSIKAAAEAEEADSGRSHDSVQGEIMELRRKLEGRRKVEKASAEVEKARERVVVCLRTNDRRPLDCWEEVDTFKRLVASLERGFIERAGR